MVRVSPPKIAPLSRWVEEVIRLPVGLAADPGLIKLAPYMRAIADAITDPKIERVTCIKSARVGWTTLMAGAVAHFMLRDPCRILALWPTESDARGWILSDLEPILAGSPALADVLPVPRPGKLTHDTILHRTGERGAMLTAVGAGAPRNLRRHSARVLIVDEADACESLSEGNPIALAIQRTLSFPNRKILVGSTPLAEETSHIARLFAESDQRIWEVPCPECATFNEIAWRDVEWPEGKPELAAWRCPACRALVPEKFKAQMVRRGRWRALRPDAAGHAGFRINALVSLLANATWSKLAAEFLRAKDDSDTLRVFVNTVLGEPWREQADEIDEAALAARAEGFDLDHIPAEVLAITAGIDVQDDRVEASIVGHARDGTAFVLAHQTLWGSPLDDDLWLEVDALLRQRWRHPLGGALKVDAAAIDAGDGGHFDAVVAFAAARLGRRVLAIKGVAGFARPAIALSKTKRGRLFIVGVDPLKSQIINRLARGRSIRFSHTLEAAYFEQLAAERRVTRMARGRPVVRFERKVGMRAESLDCLVYALAAKAALALNAAAFDLRTDELRSATPPTPPPTAIRSQWMQR